MKNFVQPGENLDVSAPYALASGEAFMVGELFGVAAGSAESGASVVMVMEGVFELSKKTGVGKTFAVGAPCYWDATEKKLDSDDNSGAFPKVGHAVASAIAGDATVKVKLA